MTENQRQPKPPLWEKLKPKARQMRHTPTKAEQLLWQKLRSRQVNGFKFRRQHAIDRLIVDFYCPEAGLVIEVDGPIRAGFIEEDAFRQEYLEHLDLRVLRFTNDQVLREIYSVICQIHQALQPTHLPSP